MTDTQRRIRAYKRALPHMRERVIAVAMLLVMSITMMTSASFAWLTLSRSPEVSSITTTVAANGNLEIALSDTDGLQPDESKVGDGNTDDVSISNLTWGNLINLAHASYGLDYLTLRPATLNTTDLLNSPMYSVEYTEDGRISGMITDFAFTNFVEREGGVKAFEVPTGSMKYGVRAISSVTYSDVAGASLILSLRRDMNTAFSNAKAGIQAICNEPAYMQLVSDLVGVHVGSLIGGNSTVTADQVKVLWEMIQDFSAAVDEAGNVVVAVANLQHYKDLGINNTSYEPYTLDDLVSGKLNFYETDTNRGADAIITSVRHYLSTRTKTQNAYTAIKKVFDTGAAASWSSLKGAVNNLCDMDSATLNGYKASDIMTMLSNKNVGPIFGLLSGSVATINGGAINDIEKLLGERTFYVDNQNGSLKINIPVPEKYQSLLMGQKTLELTPATIKAGATAPYYMEVDMQAANRRAEEDTGALGTPVAAETYAMAIDFWVRTNANNALLILEGELDGYYEKQVDSDGNPIMIPDPNDPSGETKVQLEEWVTTGYKGVNRVWTELDDPNSDAYLDLEDAALGSSFISATQGSGSCYVFYAEDPENQAQCLHMLSAMRVAFVDAEGVLLAEAYMNTSNAVEQSGRVIVPLQLVAKTPVTMEDGSTESHYIQRLPKNEAQRITALIYMDGANLENTDVMEAGTIEGQLNIQFGTTQLELLPLDPMDDEVKKDFYVIDVITADKTGDNAIPVYDETTKCSTKVEVSITGTNPTSVKGNFISVINETQGAREETFTMQKNAQTGYWEADVPFSGPGNFQLRSLRIDGVDVALDGEEILDITIKGTAVTALSWEFSKNTHSVMTAASQRAVNMNLSLSSSSNMVHAVRGVFLGDNGQNISVNFIPEGDHYVGTANFNSSSTYRMTYVEIDGVPTPLQESMYKTITLQLGLRANVTISKPVLESGEVNETILWYPSLEDEENPMDPGDARRGWQFFYTCTEPLIMDVQCTLTDDQNQQLTNLSNVELLYKSGDKLLDSDMTWNPDSKCYEGKFKDFKYSGTFEFFSVNVGAEEVTVATSAAKITSIPPDEMEYIPLTEDDIQPLVYDLTMDSEKRGFNLYMKNAAAAELTVDLALDLDQEPDQTTTIAATNNGNGTFFVPVPSDGQWTITGLKVGKVFYEGKFYDGSEGNTLNLLDQQKTPISTYFLTDVHVKATDPNAVPKTDTVNFMEAKTYSGLTVEVFNVQGTDENNGVKRPLSDVLEDVNKLNPNVSTNVSVELDYGFSKSGNYTYDETAANVPKAPKDIMGNYDEVSKQYEMGEMGDLTFQLQGTYNPVWTVTIGGTEYKSNDTEKKVDFDQTITQTYTLNWNLPSLTITAVSEAGSVDIANSDVSDTKTGSGLIRNSYTTSSMHHNDGTHNESNTGKKATVFMKCTHSGGSYTAIAPRTHDYQPAEVTITLQKLEGVTYATLTFANADLNRNDVQIYGNFGNTGGSLAPDTYDGTSSYTWESGSGSKKMYIGDVNGSITGSDVKTPAGTIIGKTLALTYNGVVYTFTLSDADAITIVNEW